MIDHPKISANKNYTVWVKNIFFPPLSEILVTVESQSSFAAAFGLSAQCEPGITPKAVRGRFECALRARDHGKSSTENVNINS
jgi:hypothetical protein